MINLGYFYRDVIPVAPTLAFVNNISIFKYSQLLK